MQALRKGNFTAHTIDLFDFCLAIFYAVYCTSMNLWFHCLQQSRAGSMTCAGHNMLYIEGFSAAAQEIVVLFILNYAKFDKLFFQNLFIMCNIDSMQHT